MRLGSSPRQHPMTKEEKEARLKTFISDHLAAAKRDGASALSYRLLALSMESPAACALRGLAAELAEAGVTVEIVLTKRTQTPSPEHADCRFVTDARLLDAHEQLVLDSSTVWIGDCMRRDPQRRDTYEQFSSDSPATAARAAGSFAQIWRAAGRFNAERKTAPVRAVPLFDPSLIAGAEQAPAPALLRH